MSEETPQQELPLETPAATPPAQQPPIDLAAISARLEELSNQNIQLARIIAEGRQAPQQEQTQLDMGQVNVDPEIQKLLQGSNAQMMRHLQSIQERLDSQESRTHAAMMGYDEETQRLAEGLYQSWRKEGWKAQDGKPMTRIDALRYVRGVQAEQNAGKMLTEKRAARERQSIENSAAFVETGGGSRKVSRPKLEEMSLQDRLAKGYAHLDEEGF